MVQRLTQWWHAILSFFQGEVDPVTHERSPSPFVRMVGRGKQRITDGARRVFSGNRRGNAQREHFHEDGAGRARREDDILPASGIGNREVNPLGREDDKNQKKQDGLHTRKAAPGESEHRHRRSMVEEPQISPLFVFRSKPKPRNFVLSVIVTTMKLLVILILVVGISGLGFGLGIARAYVETTPDLDVARIENQSETTFIYDSDGQLITQYIGTENRIWATREEIPQNLINAIVSIEDTRFYTHNGIDIKRIVGALFSNMRSSSTQGGSTITQQLIKMRILSSEQTYKRKLQEAYLAIQLEKEYSKDDILVAYLNTINLAQTNYGVKAAAEDYFGKELQDLTLRECAMLAGCAQSPYTYDPRSNFYTRNRPELTNKRTDMVLAAMYKNNYITKEQYEEALNDQLVILEKSPRKQQYDYPYFVEYAISDVITHMLRDRGLEDTNTNRSQIETEIRTGGYKIYTTMDRSIQDTLEETVYNWDGYPKVKNSEYATKTLEDGTVLQEPQVAADVVESHTGYVRGIVGGRQEPTTKKGLNRATRAQPVGSSIKPIAVYGPAIDQGVGAGTIIADVPAEVKGWGGRGYPNNSGNKFHGPVSLRKGIVNSYNVVAARTLADYVGYDTSASYLQALGVKSRINVDGPGLALGTTGLTVLEMAGAYTALANGGEYIEPVTFTRVEDSKGNVILDSSKTQIRRQVFKESTAWLLTDILEDAVSYGTGTRAKLENMTTAGKTGTNSDNLGVYFTGYTPYYISAIWVGHDDYKPLASTSGGKGAAPVFKEYMTKIHEGLENKPIYSKTAEEVGLKKVTVCGVSGMLATDACSQDAAGYGTVTDYFPADAVPTQRCNMHQLLSYCSVSGKLASPYCPVDTIVTKAGLVIPSDSIYRKLSTDTLLTYLPNAILDYEVLGNLSYDNPDQRAYFCDVHTEEWAQQQAALGTLISQSQTLINQVQGQMEGVTLTADAQNQLNVAIANLVEACNVTKEATAIQNAYNTLSALQGQYLSDGQAPQQPSQTAPGGDGGNDDEAGSND